MPNTTAPQTMEKSRLLHCGHRSELGQQPWAYGGGVELMVVGTFYVHLHAKRALLSGFCGCSLACS